MAKPRGGMTKAADPKSEQKAGATPGPWEPGTYSDGKVVMAGLGDARVRVADCRNPDNHEEATERANATLICAAPDLLAACEFVLAHEDKGFTLSPRDSERLRLAIAKARGGA